MVDKPAEFLKLTASTRGSAYLGIDPGDRYVGYAIADEVMKIATPQDVWDIKDWAKFIVLLKKHLQENGVKGMVCGWPINMDGSIGERCVKTRAFVEKLEENIDIPILLWDERLTSFQAEQLMSEHGAKRSQIKSKNHSVAASLILQSFMDYLNHPQRAKNKA